MKNGVGRNLFDEWAEAQGWLVIIEEFNNNNSEITYLKPDLSEVKVKFGERNQFIKVCRAFKLGEGK